MIDLLSFDLDLDYIVNYIEKFIRILLSGHITFKDALGFTIISSYIVISSLIGVVYWFLEGKMYKRILTIRGIQNPDLAYVPYAREFVLSKLVDENGRVRLFGKLYVSTRLIQITGILDDILGFILGVLIPRMILSFVVYGRFLTEVYSYLNRGRTKRVVILSYIFSLFALPRIIYLWVLYKKYCKSWT